MHIYPFEGHKWNHTQHTVCNLLLTYHRHLLTLVHKVLAHSFCWWLGHLVWDSLPACKILVCSPSLLTPQGVSEERLRQQVPGSWPGPGQTGSQEPRVEWHGVALSTGPAGFQGGSGVRACLWAAEHPPAHPPSDRPALYAHHPRPPQPASPALHKSAGGQTCSTQPGRPPETPR